MSSLPSNISRIEGGLDAIVVGASFDGAVAAASLARQGLSTVLVESDCRVIDAEPKELFEGVFADLNDGPLLSLDRGAVNALDLFRHGLAFQHRRIASAYVLNGETILVDTGDPRRIADGLVGENAPFGERLSAFLDKTLDAADGLPRMGASLDQRFANAFGDDVSAPLTSLLADRFEDERARAVFLAEGALGRADRPDAPFTSAALLSRFSGGVNALQGALAYPEEGVRGLMNAVRRAGQAHGLEYRQGGRVKRALIEWDHVAGVEFEDGGQLRAPVVISALPAQTAFFDHIGEERLDLEFAASLRARPRAFCFATAHLALKFDDMDGSLTETARLVLTQTEADLIRSYGACERGETPDRLIATLFLPKGPLSAEALKGGAQVYGILTFGPLAPSDPIVDEKALKAAAERALTALFGESEAWRIAGASFVVAQGRSVLAAEEARLAALQNVDALDGYFFCGPEADLGPGPSGAAGVRAAARAADYLRMRG